MSKYFSAQNSVDSLKLERERERSGMKALQEKNRFSSDFRDEYEEREREKKGRSFGGFEVREDDRLAEKAPSFVRSFVSLAHLLDLLHPGFALIPRKFLVFPFFFFLFFYFD